MGLFCQSSYARPGNSSPLSVSLNFIAKLTLSTSLGLLLLLSPAHPTSLLRGKIELPNKEGVFDGKIEDLSDRGARISVDRPMLMPTEFILHVPLKDWRKNAIVRWRDDYYLGVIFFDGNRPNIEERLKALDGELMALRQDVMGLTK